MDFMETVAYLGAAVVFAIALAAIFLAYWRRAEAYDAPVLLYPMLRRQGRDVARLAVASGGRDFALAVHRCLRCGATARCGEWLESGDRDGFDSFCANAGYVSHVSRLASLAAPARMSTLVSAGAEPDLSRAVYRCIACQESPRCDKLLDAGRAAEVVAFCPNRDFVARHRPR